MSPTSPLRVAVAGATGVVGRHVVAVAEERGHTTVPLTRGGGVDLTTGTGLADRLAGIDAVVDVTSVGTQRSAVSEAFFGSVTETLLAAEREAGVGHHVVLSIVGIDDAPSGYYDGKRLQERVVAGGDRPWSVLRATQFHEFAEQLLGFATVGPVSVVPRMTSQPVAAREVGEALVDLVEAGPSGRVPDLGGPEVLAMHGLARRVAREQGRAGRGRRRVVVVPVPGAAGKAMRDGTLTLDGHGHGDAHGDAVRGRVTFGEWLAQHYPSDA